MRRAATPALLDQLNPRIKVVQSEEPDGPTECISVLNQDFKSLTWEALSNVPTYGAWLRETDHRSAYDYHQQVLQVLQSGGVRGRWSLKSPHHAMRLEALHAVMHARKQAGAKWVRRKGIVQLTCMFVCA